MQGTGVSGKGDKQTNHHLGRIPEALALHQVISQLVSGFASEAGSTRVTPQLLRTFAGSRRTVNDRYPLVASDGCAAILEHFSYRDAH
jgi:hypothetical protein